ncbi:hypothetical protein ACWEJZ_28270 [Streptomyces bacillaris]
MEQAVFGLARYSVSGREAGPVGALPRWDGDDAFGEAVTWAAQL